MAAPPSAPPPSGAAPPQAPIAPSLSSLLSALRPTLPSTVPAPSKLLQSILEPVPTAAPAPPIANIHIKPERDEAEERKEAEEKKAAEDKKAEEKAKKRKSKDGGDGAPKVPKPVKIKAPKREDDGSGRKKKVVTVKRLLLNDAVAHADSMDGWSEARKQAFKLIDTNPNAYYYRFNAPGEPQRNGAFTPEERVLFLKLYSEWLAKNPDGNIQWGMFSKEIPGRVGYQCTNFYRKLLAEGALKDPNYYTDAQGVLRHKSYAQHHANKDAPEAADAKPSAASQRPKRKRKAREESPEPDDFSDDDEEEEAPELSDGDEEEGEGGKKRNRSKSKADAADSGDSGDEAVLSPRSAKAGGKTARHTEREAQKEKRRTETYVPPNVVISTKGEALAQVALLCRECAASGPHAEFLFCVDCGDTCHRHCLSMDVKLTEETRFLWRCPDCKVCDSCHKGQDEEKMLVCDQCDRGFHIYCLSPPLAHIPDGRWLCSHCVQCKSCGTRSSDQWLVDFQYCGHCGDLYLRNNFCPSCEKCYEEDDVTSKMIQCDACARWVHASCDGIDDAAYQAMTESEVDVPYKCPKCRARMAKVGTTTTPPAAPPAPAAPPPPPPPPALPHWNDAYGKAVPFFTDDAHRERRLCLFCGQEGDQFSRLIPTRLDQWAHAHCVVWAPEVGVDERTGMLRNFNNASARAKSALCASCNQPGASLACAYARCTHSYHFPCARGAECLFMENRQMFCRTHVQHRPAGVPPLVTFALPEKVSVPRLKPKNKSQSKKADPLAWRSGAVTVASLGALSARDGYHTRDAFFPIGFRSLRWAWSTTHIGQRTLYEFRVAADGNRPRFTLCDLAAPEAVAWSGASVATLWKQMTGAVNALRIAAGDKQSISGLSQLPATFYFGLTQAWVETQLEEMEHAKDCVLFSYVFKHNAAYMKPSEDAAVEEVSRNPTGCARSEGLLLADLRARKPRKTGKVVGQPGASTRAPILAKIRGPGAQFDVIDMPIGTRYRLMKGRVKHLRVARSSIHDLGVYSRVPLKAGDVIVEYVGELIRPIIADKREKMYDSRGIGCYMFRLDEKLIIDATMCGNLARYINHSCGPNAFSDVVEIGGQKKIVIIAKKDISPEEEITYDYQFELEDNKIPCGCGAPNCRKFIN